MKKRYREVKAPPNTIVFKYGKSEGEEGLVVAWGEGCNKADGCLVLNNFEGGNYRMEFDDNHCMKYKLEQSLICDLEERGYDTKTLKFSIKKKRDI
jgi:hypothetical protein